MVLREEPATDHSDGDRLRHWSSLSTRIFYSTQRQRVGALHLTERKARLDRSDAFKPSQFAFQELFVGGKIRDDNTHEIIALTGHQIAVGNLRPVGNGTRKVVEVLFALAFELDRSERADRQSDLGLVDDRRVTLDDTCLLQPSQ